MSFEEFQDGPHGGNLGYWNRMILAILYLCVTVMLSIKCLAQSDIQFGRKRRLKNFKMASMVAILDIRMEQF